MDIEEYSRNYNLFKKEYLKIYGNIKDFSDKKLLREIYTLARKYKLNIDKRTGVILNPENLKSGSACKSWEYEYKVPKGNWLYNKKGDCGKGCLCVDKGADKKSLDIMNSNPKINVGQVCDGSREHKPRINKTPFLAFDYISKKPLNIEKLRPICTVAKQVIINNHGKREITNLCTDTYLSEKETKISREKYRKMFEGKINTRGEIIKDVNKYPSVLIFAKKYNTKKFWEDSAKVTSNL